MAYACSEGIHGALAPVNQLEQIRQRVCAVATLVVPGKHAFELLRAERGLAVVCLVVWPKLLVNR